MEKPNTTGLSEQEIVDKWVIDDNGKKRRLTEVWTRVMGYHRPKSYYNVGKAQEARDREYFKEEATMNSIFCAKN